VSNNSGESYQQIVEMILRKIRGKTSQTHLSSKLGLKHNHVYKWESGTRKIQWRDFVKFCLLKKIDLQPLLFDLYLFNGDQSDFVAICKSILMDFPSQSLSHQLKISKFRIDAWRSGKGPFYLEDFICIIDKFSHNLAEFSIYFLNHEDVDRLKVNLTEYKMRQFEMEHPIISLILRILESDGHAQSSEGSLQFVAQTIGLNEEEVQLLLDKANTLGFIAKKGLKYVSNGRHVDIRGKKAAKQRRFWIEKALQFMDEGKLIAPDFIFGNMIYCITQEGQNKILDEYLRFYNTARQIIEKDQGGYIPIVMNFQMLRMDKK
jgi:hypothetical protein